MNEARDRAAGDFAAGRFAAVLETALAPVVGGMPDPELLCLGGQAAMRLRRPIDAAGLLQTAVMLAPTDNVAWCNLGEAWYALRQFLAADQSWGNVADLASLSPTAARRRKVARILSGREEVDWSAIRQAVASPGIRFWTPNVAAAVPEPADRLPMLLWLGEARRGEVCVTIDDGPSPDITPLLLEILKAKKIRAAFFLVGESVARHPEIAQRIAADGHEIYSHSYSHRLFTNLDEDTIIAEVSRTEELLSRLRPTPNPYPVRLPGGMGWNMPHVHRAIRRWNTDAVLVHWTVDPRDWAARASIALHGDPVREARTCLYEIALDPALGGAIVLTHDCQIGLPRTSTVYIRHFFEGLASLISEAHLKATPLFPIRETPALPTTPAAPQNTQAPSGIGGQKMTEVVCVDHTNWARFTSMFEVNGAPVLGWRRTLAQPWVDPSRPVAYVLVEDRKCVGWLQTIYADTRFGDGAPPTLICSLSGWYVREDQRSHSLKLLLRAMSDADTTPMTVFTASKNVTKIYTALHWHLLDNERWTISLAERTDGPVLIDDIAAVFDRLTPGEQRVMNDHRANKLNHAMIALDDRYCYFAYLVHERLNQQVADIIFLAGEVDLLLEEWYPAAATPLRGCDFLHVDCRYFGDRSVNLSRGRMWGTRMFRGPVELRNKLSMLYSEVPIYHPFLL
jgi:peptidoglycan/xylan/chitin deacetylase (PgdA/CDA1 family)